MYYLGNDDKKKGLYRLNCNYIVHSSKNVTFFPQIFLIPDWLNPGMQNLWIQRADCISFL